MDRRGSVDEKLVVSKKALARSAAYILIASFFVIYQLYHLGLTQIIFAATPILFSQNQSTPASGTIYSPTQNNSFSVRITPTNSPVDSSNVIFQLGRLSTGTYTNYSRCANGGLTSCTWNDSIGVFRINFTGPVFDSGAGITNLTWFARDASTAWNKSQTVQYVLTQPPSGGSSISLSKGWNLISFDVLQVNSISSDTCGVSGKKFYYLNSQTKAWDSYYYNQLQGGKGYWINIESSGACNFAYSGIGSPSITDVLPLKTGWNLIGTKSGSSYDISSVIGTCAGKMALGPLYWDSALQQWVPTTNINQKAGYWIYVTSDCQLS